MKQLVVKSAEEKKVIHKMFWNSGLVFCAFNQVKMMGNAFTNTMAPVIEELYTEEEEKCKALKRHNGYFNTHAVFFAFIAGLTYALEKEKKEKGTVDDETIESIKVALMGPSAGIGDAFFFNCVRVIAAGIGIGLCSQGNALGVLLFILLYGGTQFVARWYMLNIGYTLGTSFIDKVFESGLINALTKAATIIGLTMVGAMVSGINVNLAWTINIGDTSVVILDVINSIMPGLLSIVIVLIYMKLIKKGIRPVALVLINIVIAIFLAWLGIF